MSEGTDMDSSLSVRRSLRNAVNQSLMSQDDTTNRKRDSLEEEEVDTGLTDGLRRAKRIKIEQADDEYSDEEEDIIVASKRGRSRPKQRYSTKKHPLQNKQRRHSSGEFPRRRGKEDFPVRRSTREKRLIFATLNTADMLKQIEGQQAFPLYETEDWMDPYEKLLSPRRDLRRSSRHRHGEKDGGGEASEGGGGASGGKSSGSEGKKGEEDENKEKQEHEGTGTGSNGDESGKEEEEGESDDEQSEGEGEVGYYLRKRRPVIYQYQPVLQVVEDDTPPKTRRRQRGGGNLKRPSTAYIPRKPRVDGARKRQAQHHGNSSTSSSGTDSDEAKFRRRKKRSMAKARSLCLPMNFDPEDVSTGSVIRDRSRIGASLADVDPMSIDREVTFDLVGGHKHHIRALKEMIVFPLLYPEVFERFKITPPRGVLFFGPPGCGKTLMARALANECSKGGKKVAFFMRKGADCLSKWVGESERQLRLLFDQAYQMRPSIIFFDEIDGLAPVRSSRQDQIHSSIVSTLLALMDGLDNRGEIVVIGATNRIDAIDPALRRPGRFDREFVFPLPSREDRLNILSIHTRLWQPQLKPAFLSELADNTVGYCGADLRALCTEATLYALRRKYPQIYNTTQKLVLDVSSINVQASDFYKSLKSIVPTAQRSDASSGRALAEIMRPLYLETLSSALAQVGFIFPPAWKLVNKAGKEVQGLLEIEAKCSEELKTNIEMFQSAERRNSVLVETSAELHRVNHSGVNNWSGHADKRRSSTCKTGSSSRQKEIIRSSLFKIDNLEDIYFDLSEVVEDETQRDSILVAEENSTSDVATVSLNKSNERATAMSAATSTRYLSNSSHPHATPPVYRPRLIVCGQGGMGQSSHLAPAILHALEDFQVQTLDLPALFAVSTKTPEEACAQIFREAKRLAPSVVYVPQISSWWEIVPGTFHATFLSILCSLPPDTPLLVLATTECPWTDLPPLLKDLFREVNSEVFTLAPPSREQRMRFFSRVLLEKPLLPPPPPPRAPTAEVLEELSVAPSPQSRKLTNEELTKIEKQREAVLRELRIFLRDTTNKLLAERKFKEFVKPVNPEEVPDYHEIISVPMDLSTIMRKIDEHRYTTPKQWMIDVNHITMNSLEYNPEHDSESRLLRHRALALQDTANSILDHELSEDFEKQCEEIADTYKRLGKDPSESSPLKYAQRRRATSQSDDPHADLYNAPRRSLRQKGLQAEERGFPYYSPSKSRLVKHERGASHDHIMDYEQRSGEEETQDELTSQSEPAKMCASKRHPLQNSNVRRQIIRPWEDHSPSPTLPNGTTESSEIPTVVESSSVTTAAEALVEMGTGTPPKLNALQDVDSTRHHARLPSTEAVDVIIERGRLLALFERVVVATEEASCEQMERMHATFEHIVFRHRMTTNRSELLVDLELAVHQTL